MMVNADPPVSLHVLLSLGGRSREVSVRPEYREKTKKGKTKKEISWRWMRETEHCSATTQCPESRSNVAAANLLLDWQPLMWKEDQSKRRATQPTTTRRKREPHITSGMRV